MKLLFFYYKREALMNFRGHREAVSLCPYPYKSLIQILSRLHLDSCVIIY
jgi:hypothetical protein